MKNDKKKRRRAKNRQTKTILVFDEKDRKEFLTGFHKRKEARKKKAKELTEQMIKKERKQLKQTRKELVERKIKHQYVPPDLEELGEELAKKEVKELPHHTVTITDMSEVDLVGQGGLRLGKNQTVEDQKSDDDSDTPEVEVSQKKKQNIMRKMEEKIQKRARHLKLDHASKKKFKKTLSKKKKHKRKLPE